MTTDRQTSDTVVMVRPAAFGFHAEAARSNAFAHAGRGGDDAARALGEFDALAEQLGAAGIDVAVLDDTATPAKPDAVYPNNWVSFHADGTMVLYPMATAARRDERRPDAVAYLLERRGFDVRRTVDLSPLERSGHFLEGTGSLIFDRPRRTAFAALGPRTSRQGLDAFAGATGFDIVAFDCADARDRPIYHTNVMLSLGERFAILCEAAVVPKDRARLRWAIEASGRDIIAVDFDAMERFSCNLLELRAPDGPVIALSQAALAALNPVQRAALERHGSLVAAAIPTIEHVGGGSVRCMIADVHLPRTN